MAKKDVPVMWRLLREKYSKGRRPKKDRRGDPKDRPSWLQPLRRLGYRNVIKGPGSDMI